jgi:3-oxoacyl-[acyl-carrier protein] reductase
MDRRATSIVTGASKGIGRAIALRLGRDGFHVLVHYNRDQAGGEKTLAALREQGSTGDLLQFDVADNKQIEAALDQYVQAHPETKISALVNNAGIHIDGLTGMMSDESYEKVMRTNAFGSFYLMRWCVKKMIRERAGSIVNIASLAGQTGNAGQINYAASKAAIIAMTKTLCMEVGSRNIRVNAVAPGLIETEMITDVPHLEDFKKRIPLGRFGSADEVAGAVSFLCSKDATYVTGNVLSVNGGLFPT